MNITYKKWYKIYIFSQRDENDVSDMIEWCILERKLLSSDWMFDKYHTRPKSILFAFKNKEDAVLFKLTWGGK